MSMNVIFRFFILFSLSLSFSVVYADEIERQRIIDAVKKYGIDEKGYLAKDGKSRYFATYEFGKDGGVDLKFKKSYLPAVTDGINRDKTSKFNIPPNAKKIANWFGKAANRAMYLSMIIDVLGEGVDYVMDPANNSVQYTNKDYEYCSSSVYCSTNKDAVIERGINSIRSIYNYKNGEENNYQRYWSGDNYWLSGHTIIMFRRLKTQETKVMTDEELAREVIKLATVANNQKAQQVITDVAKDAVKNGDYDVELQQLLDDLEAVENPDDTTDNPDTDTPKPSSPETDNNGGNNSNQDKFELPAFCDWAKPVCGFIDWFKTEPDYPDSDLPEQDIPLKTPAEFDKDYVRANAQCPADIVVPFNTGFSSHELVFNLSPICDFVRIYLSKVVLIMSYVFATLHISSAFKV